MQIPKNSMVDIFKWELRFLVFKRRPRNLLTYPLKECRRQKNKHMWTEYAQKAVENFTEENVLANTWIRCVKCLLIKM